MTETKANHISLYSLTIEEETPLGKIFENGEIDYDFDKADSMWLSGRDFLKSKGFVQYEVSNFCKHDKKSIHNLSYWNHESYIGCGSGATGTKYKSDASAYRWTNTRDIKKYIDFWNNEKIDREKIPEECEKIERDTSKFEFFMMGLRTLDGIKKSRFEKIFGETFSSDTEMLFQKWKREGKAVINGDIYALNEKGILYLNDFLSSI